MLTQPGPKSRYARHSRDCLCTFLRLPALRHSVPKHFDAGKLRSVKKGSRKELVETTRRDKGLFYLGLTISSDPPSIAANLAYLGSFDTTMARGHAAVFHQILSRSVGRSVGRVEWHPTKWKRFTGVDRRTGKSHCPQIYIF